MKRKFAPLLLLATLLPLRLLGGDSGAARDDEFRHVAELLNQALKERSALDVDELVRLQAAGKKIVEVLGIDHLGSGLLGPAIESAKTPNELRACFKQVSEMVTFQPTMEAAIPTGFPEWTPVSKIEVKRYPTYRMAQFDMQRDVKDSSAFFTLFNHIKKNDIEMTAPVEMEYDLQHETKPQPLNMAFLYSSTDLGSLGEDQSGVEVKDVPAMLVVSIGMRGPTSDDQIELARNALQSWIDRNQAAYAADGALRVMGYNSPFVRGNRRYFEVQIPLREVAPRPAAE